MCMHFGDMKTFGIIVKSETQLVARKLLSFYKGILYRITIPECLINIARKWCISPSWYIPIALSFARESAIVL